MVRRRAQLTEDDDEATTRERIAATLDEYVEDAGERERIGPALLSLLGVEEAPAGGRDTLFPAWRLFFERIAERGTTVLVFEDLQWADTGLLDFIDHLLDWSRACRSWSSPWPGPSCSTGGRTGGQPAPPDRPGARAVDR